MKKIIPLMILIITIGCSQYSSYDECYVNEMSKMPSDLNKWLQRDYSDSAESFCYKFKSN